MLQKIFGNTTEYEVLQGDISTTDTQNLPHFYPFQLPPPISAFIHGQKCLEFAPYTRGPRKSHLPINQVTRQTDLSLSCGLCSSP